MIAPSLAILVQSILVNIWQFFGPAIEEQQRVRTPAASQFSQKHSLVGSGEKRHMMPVDAFTARRGCNFNLVIDLLGVDCSSRICRSWT